MGTQRALLRTYPELRGQLIAHGNSGKGKTQNKMARETQKQTWLAEEGRGAEQQRISMWKVHTSITGSQGISNPSMREKLRTEAHTNSGHSRGEPKKARSHKKEAGETMIKKPGKRRKEPQKKLFSCPGMTVPVLNQMRKGYNQILNPSGAIESRLEEEKGKSQEWNNPRAKARKIRIRFRESRRALLFNGERDGTTRDGVVST